MFCTFYQIYRPELWKLKNYSLITLFVNTIDTAFLILRTISNTPNFIDKKKWKRYLHKFYKCAPMTINTEALCTPSYRNTHIHTHTSIITLCIYIWIPLFWKCFMIYKLTVLIFPPYLNTHFLLLISMWKLVMKLSNLFIMVKETE